MFAIQFAVLLLLCEVIHCLEPMCGVLCRKKQTGAVTKKSAVEPFGQGIFPIEVSLHSDLGRRLNHNSQQLQLSPPNQHPKLSHFKTKLEDSPSKDKVTPLDYQEDESNILTKEEKITEDRRMTFTRERKSVLKTLKRSKRGLKEEILKNSKTDILKQCCRDGHEHFTKDKECHEGLKEKKKMKKPPCYKAFNNCCEQFLNNYVKPLPIGYHPGNNPNNPGNNPNNPGNNPYRCKVSMPEFWKVSEPQIVTVDCNPWFYQYNNYLVKIMLLSYPDKNVTYDSEEIMLNSTSRTNMNYDSHEFHLNPSSEMEAAVILLIKLEDLPKRDESEQFVYLKITNDHNFIEKRIQLLDLRVTQKDLKKPNGSMYKLEREIETMANKYHIWKAKQACRDAYQHYIVRSECQSQLKVFEEERKLGLYRVFRKCCLHTREYIHSLANTEPESYNNIMDGW